MIAYLNGVNVLNGRKKFRPFGGKGKKALDKLKATGKKLNDKRKALDKKIIAKAKDLAKKAGAGIKRFAQINKTIQEKALIFALEKNLMGMSSRLKATYKVSPQSVKALLKPMGNWEKLKKAINKGDKKAPAIIGEFRSMSNRSFNVRNRMRAKSLKGMPRIPKRPIRQAGETAEFFGKRLANYSRASNIYKTRLKAFLTKGRLSGDEEAGEEGTGAGAGGQAEQTAENVKQGVSLIQKIMAFFKKRKEDKKGDAETVQAMANSVDADPNIPKVDENGKELPVPAEAKEIDKVDKATGKEEKTDGGGLMSNKPLLIGGALALVVGGYLLMKKK